MRLTNSLDTHRRWGHKGKRPLPPADHLAESLALGLGCLVNAPRQLIDALSGKTIFKSRPVQIGLPYGTPAMVEKRIASSIQLL